MTIQMTSTPNRHVRDHPLNGHTADIAKPTRLTVRPEGANYQ
jgi:hypothetical protein